jgi:hypothetical protein
MRKQNSSTESAKKQIANEKEISSVSNAASSTTAPEAATEPQVAIDVTPTTPNRIVLAVRALDAASMGASYLDTIVDYLEALRTLSDPKHVPIEELRHRLSAVHKLARQVTFVAEQATESMDALKEEHRETLDIVKGGV